MLLFTDSIGETLCGGEESMGIFLTLYHFEMKKILRRRTTAVSLFIGILVIGMLMGMPLAQDGYYYKYEAGQELPERVRRPNREIEAVRREYLITFEGQILDGWLMEQWKQAYLDSEAGTKQWNLNGYKPFLYLNTMPDLQEASAEDFYRRYTCLSEQEREGLTEAELAYWEEKADGLAPYTVGYAGGWQTMISITLVYTLITTLVVTVGVCDLFSQEHRFRTDQLALSGAKGRKLLFAAKMAAGASLAAGVAALGFLVQLAACGILYGFSGFGVSIQFLEAGDGCLYPLSGGQFAVLILALLALGSVMVSSFVMLLSELTRTPMAGLIAVFLMGLMSILGIFQRIGGVVWQIFSYLPAERIRTEILREYRLVRLGNLQFNCIEFSFLLYPLLAVFFGFLCWKCYNRFQVAGR